MRWVAILPGSVIFNGSMNEISQNWFKGENVRGEWLVPSPQRPLCGERAGLHNPDSDRMEDHFSAGTGSLPHEAVGMPREFIQELRGDVRKEAIDIYDHIDRKELRESYLAHILQLGV